MVSNFITDGQWDFPNHRCLMNIQEVVTTAKEVKIYQDNLDTIVWTVNKLGKFNTRDTYNAIRDRCLEPHLTKLIWFKDKIPRHSMISWLAMQNRLKTKAKLFKWGKVDNTNCSMCTYGYEDENHIFFDCPFANSCWNSIVQLLGFQNFSNISSWKDMIDWCNHNFHSKGWVVVIQRLSLGSFVYQIWAERNNRVFSKVEKNAKQVFSMIVADVRLKLTNKKMILRNLVYNKMLIQRWNLSASFSDPHIIECAWAKPPLGFHLINTDGAVKDTTSGHGAVIREASRDVVVAACGTSNANSSILAELKGILMGLSLAKNHHIQKVYLNVDSQVVVSMILSKGDTTPWYLKILILSITSLMGDFSNCVIGHIYRETNRAADFLDSMIPNCEFLELDMDHLEMEFKAIIKEDMEGRVYLRQ